MMSRDYSNVVAEKWTHNLFQGRIFQYIDDDDDDDDDDVCRPPAPAGRRTSGTLLAGLRSRFFTLT